MSISPETIQKIAAWLNHKIPPQQGKATWRFDDFRDQRGGAYFRFFGADTTEMDKLQQELQASGCETSDSYITSVLQGGYVFGISLNFFERVGLGTAQEILNRVAASWGSTANQHASQQTPNPAADEERGNLREDENYYNVLRLDSTASRDDIKRAYRRRMQAASPDKPQNHDRRAEAESETLKIRKAYDVLYTPDNRAIYDSFGAPNGVAWETIREWHEAQQAARPAEPAPEPEQGLNIHILLESINNQLRASEQKWSYNDNPNSGTTRAIGPHLRMELQDPDEIKRWKSSLTDAGVMFDAGPTPRQSVVIAVSLESLSRDREAEAKLKKAASLFRTRKAQENVASFTWEVSAGPHGFLGDNLVLRLSEGIDNPEKTKGLEDDLKVLGIDYNDNDNGLELKAYSNPFVRNNAVHNPEDHGGRRLLDLLWDHGKKPALKGKLDSIQRTFQSVVGKPFPRDWMPQASGFAGRLKSALRI